MDPLNNREAEQMMRAQVWRRLSYIAQFTALAVGLSSVGALALDYLIPQSHSIIHENIELFKPYGCLIGPALLAGASLGFFLVAQHINPPPKN